MSFIMILLFLFGARCHYHHDIIGAQWGNLMIPLYGIIVFLFLGGFFPCRGPTTTTTTSTSTSTSTTTGSTTSSTSTSSNVLLRILYGPKDIPRSGDSSGGAEMAKASLNTLNPKP